MLRMRFVMRIIILSLFWILSVKESSGGKSNRVETSSWLACIQSSEPIRTVVLTFHGLIQTRVCYCNTLRYQVVEHERHNMYKYKLQQHFGYHKSRINPRPTSVQLLLIVLQHSLVLQTYSLGLKLERPQPRLLQCCTINLQVNPVVFIF